MKGADNMPCFVKVSNKIFEYNLSPKSFMVYVFLCSKVSVSRNIVIKCGTIASYCNICRQSVMTAIKELEDKHLISKYNRFGSFGYKSSLFNVKNIVATKGWFRVETAIFDTQIKPTDFVVYSFIKKCMFNGTSEAYPSVNYISKNTFISHRRVETAVKFLQQFCFVNKINRKNKDLSFKRNRYLRFAYNLSIKKAVRSPQHTTYKLLHPSNYNYTTSQSKNQSFFNKWVVHFFNNTS